MRQGTGKLGYGCGRLGQPSWLYAVVRQPTKFTEDGQQGPLPIATAVNAGCQTLGLVVVQDARTSVHKSNTTSPASGLGGRVSGDWICSATAGSRNCSATAGDGGPVATVAEMTSRIPAPTLLVSVEPCSEPEIAPPRDLFGHHAACQRGAMFPTRPRPDHCVDHVNTAPRWQAAWWRSNGFLVDSLWF